MKKSEDIKELIAAMVKFNGEITRISKDAQNPFFKNNYATLDQIIDNVRPVLASHGLVIMQDVSTEESGSITVSTSLFHETGQFIESTGTTLKPEKQNPQGIGSAISYAKRYDLTTILSLNTGEDDDGQHASQKSSGNSASGNQSNRSNVKEPIKKPAPKPKTSSLTQQSEIERKAKEYIKIQGTGTISALMEFLKISDIKLISENHAKVSIKKLDEIIAAAKKKQEADTLKELQE